MYQQAQAAFLQHPPKQILCYLKPRCLVSGRGVKETQPPSPKGCYHISLTSSTVVKFQRIDSWIHVSPLKRQKLSSTHWKAFSIGNLKLRVLRTPKKQVIFRGRHLLPRTLDQVNDCMRYRYLPSNFHRTTRV